MRACKPGSSGESLLPWCADLLHHGRLLKARAAPQAGADGFPRKPGGGRKGRPVEKKRRSKRAWPEQRAGHARRTKAPRKEEAEQPKGIQGTRHRPGNRRLKGTGAGRAKPGQQRDRPAEESLAISGRRRLGHTTGWGGAPATWPDRRSAGAFAAGQAEASGIERGRRKPLV